MTAPTILTVILNYRTLDLTLAAAAAALRAMQGLRGEVVVVDNDSRDGSFEALTEAARARGWTQRGLRVLQSGRNGGYGAGNNFGIRAGLSGGLSGGRRPDYVYVLNSDARPAPGAIRALLDHVQAHPRCGIAGSLVHGPDDAWHCTCFRFPSILSEFEDAARVGAISRLFARSRVPLSRPDRPVQVDWVAGASALIRTAMLEGADPFDEGFFLYFEETDLCRRIRARGWTVDYIPQSRVMHLGGASTGSKTWRRVPDYWFASRNRYFRKSHGGAYAAAATTARVAGMLVWRLKRLVIGHKAIDPPHVLRDLVRHALPRGLSGPTARRRSQA